MRILRIVMQGEEHPHYTITKAFHDGFGGEGFVYTIFWDKYEDRLVLNSEVIKIAEKVKPDVVFMQLQQHGVLFKEIVEKLSKNSLVLNWTGDVRKSLEDYIYIAPYVVTLFTNTTDVESMRTLGYDSEYLQTGYDHNVYKNIHWARTNGMISFCANNYKMDFALTEYREEVARSLMSSYSSNFRLHGSNWSELGAYYKGVVPISNTEEHGLYSQSEIAISVSHFNYGRYFSDRLLREMASGVLVLSHRYQDCDLDFVDGRHLVFFDNTIDLLEKCNYYIQNKHLARVIGEQGAEYVEANFKWSNFIENLIHIIKKHTK